MTTIVGRNVKVEVATTFSTAKSITSVSKANPGKATLNAHGLASGACGFWSVTAGMVELDQQAGRVYNQTANDFDIQGVDTTDYSAWTAGTFTPAATWQTIAESTSYEIGGGAAASLDDTRLLDVKTRNVNGLLAAQSLTIGVKNQTISGTGMDFVETQARRGLNVLLRITLSDGSVRLAYGTPSLPGESVQAGALASGQFSVNVPGWVTKGAA